MRSGTFISLEGIDGCGKSTQLKLLAAEYEAAGREVVCLREPGGAPLSEKVRELLLDPANTGMAPECEVLLFQAGRAQNVRTVVEPALARGAVVLFDRFADSSTAYQQAARGLSPEFVAQANALGTCGLWPQLTLVFDLDPRTAAKRRAGQDDDRIEAEGLAFQRRVREGYHALAEREPARVRLVSAEGTPEEVHELVVAILAEKGLL